LPTEKRGGNENEQPGDLALFVQVELQGRDTSDLSDEDPIFNYRQKYLPTSQVPFNFRRFACPLQLMISGGISLFPLCFG
jgi:hypothetical protein